MAEVYTVAAVRAQVSKYLLGTIDRVQITEWLTPLVWLEEGDAEAVDLAWEVALLLAEASRGHLTEEELREQLQNLAAPSVPA